MPRLRYYISGHGLGHASRSCLILQSLATLFPEITLEVVSDAAAWFLNKNLPQSATLLRRRFDIGVCQSDSLAMQLDDTLRACRSLIAEAPQQVAAEAEELARHRVDLVATDIGALPCLAAARAGCPSVLVSNFTWDWIYEGFLDQHPEFTDIITWHRAAYSHAAAALRMPFHGPMDQPRQRIDLPLVARRSQVPTSVTRQQLGLPQGHRLGLLSFGGFGLEKIDLSSLEQLENWFFLGEQELAGQAGNLHLLPAEIVYPDLVKAADVVITKPGYGIVSEAIANRTAVLFTPRGNFREQPFLVEGMKRFGNCHEIDNQRLRRGEWQESLTQLLNQPEPTEQIALDGAEAAARQLAEMLG